MTHIPTYAVIFFVLYDGPYAHHLHTPQFEPKLLERFDEKIIQELAVRA